LLIYSVLISKVGDEEEMLKKAEKKELKAKNKEKMESRLSEIKKLNEDS